MCVWPKQRDGKTSGAKLKKMGKAAEGFTEKIRREGRSSLRPKDAPRLLRMRKRIKKFNEKA